MRPSTPGARPAVEANGVARVPFILSEPLNGQYRLEAGVATLKSYRIFDFALNGTGES